MTLPSSDTPRTARRLDPEDAQTALHEVQELLRRQQLVEELAHRQETGEDRAELIEGLLHRQHEAELQQLVNSLHPADIAFILESLPKPQRQTGWRLESDTRMNAMSAGCRLLTSCCSSA